VIVVDASVMVEVLLRVPGAERLEARLTGLGERLCAPALLDVEVAQALRRYTGRGELTPARGAEAIQLLVDFPLVRYPHAPLLARIWELRANLTAYDAAYVALAEALRAPLLTADARLAASPGHGAEIELCDHRP
jgi:predicted nucleic acid-binding protein